MSSQKLGKIISIESDDKQDINRLSFPINSITKTESKQSNETANKTQFTNEKPKISLDCKYQVVQTCKSIWNKEIENRSSEDK